MTASANGYLSNVAGVAAEAATAVEVLAVLISSSNSPHCPTSSPSLATHPILRPPRDPTPKGSKGPVLGTI